MKRIAKILVLASAILFAAPELHAQVSVGVGITANIAPPVIPVEVQPDIPGDGYIWQPGYYNYGPGGYVWVPGAWVLPPDPGLLWTPGYWGWDGGVYLFHHGYWGPHVGFYGGINYGFGYFGSGFSGGFWVGHSFHYNTAVWHIHGGGIHNTYVRNVHYDVHNRVAFNGGRGGISARPNSFERRAMTERHVGGNEHGFGNRASVNNRVASHNNLQASRNNERAAHMNQNAARMNNHAASQRSFQSRPSQPANHGGFGGNRGGFGGHPAGGGGRPMGGGGHSFGGGGHPMGGGGHGFGGGGHGGGGGRHH